MFARITRGVGSPERVDEMTAAVEKTLPTLTAQAGFRGVALLANRETGGGLSVTYWDTAAAMAASEAHAAEARQGVQSSVAGANMNDIDRFEVVVVERVVPPKAGIAVRMSDFVADASKIDAMAAFTQETVLPVLKARTGFRSAHLLANRQTGRTLTFTVWDTAADREAGYADRTPLREQLRQIAGAGPATTDLYEAVLVDIRLAAPV
jgi:heme-degrading monooxygenase HmoA